MIKILVKAAILVCIILSIYFIVNPSACSNLMSGRVVNSMEELPTFVPNDKSHSELLTPQGDQPLERQAEPAPTAEPEEEFAPVQEESAAQEPVEQPAAQPAEQPAATEEQKAAEEQPAASTTEEAPAVTDTNSALEDQAAAQEAAKLADPGKAFTQADIDYAIASRYVELENEYLAKKKDMKNAAKEISYIVMDDFELTPAEWEAFLQRATVDNLFEKVRQQQAAK